MIHGRLFALILLSVTASSSLLSVAHAAETPLPNDLQSMKGELLNLNRDISQLESELLFPSSEAAIMVSIEPGSGGKITDVSVQLDDKTVGYHYYSDAEFAAMTKGGMQRIFVGNIPSGAHTIKAQISGLDPDKKAFTRTATFSFTKNAAHKVIEMKAADNATHTQSEFRFREWDIQ